MEDRILEQLKANNSFLSPVERMISDTILADPMRFTRYSLGELAEKIGVSQGSIINFSHKFADGGFPTLKLRVAACLSDYKEQTFHVAERSDGVGTVLVKNNENLMTALRNIEAVNNEETLLSVVNRILGAKKVEIYGVYRSALVATDFCYQLLQLGVSASVVSDVFTCAVSASMLTADSLVIAVSASGQTKDILDAVKLAKGNGVPVVCLTGNPHSPLVKLSDDVLIATCAGNSLSSQLSEMRISQLALTDAICAYLQNILDENGKKYFFKLDTILNSHNVYD
ncbi:MAG: MurR/RpiR family transcriptional regulator [Ruminococcaceae bacterium]|nr:MurR/RpiR family transcriptional regulator [Oscillospiraceae bacterium]